MLGKARQFLKRVLTARMGSMILRTVGRTPLRWFLFNSVYDPDSGLMVGSGDMERDWDERARRNPHYFIACNDAASAEAFFRSGEAGVRDDVLKGIALPPGAKVLEIGCGIGRLLAPLSPLAAEVYGVDISSEMLEKGRESLQKYPNVHLLHTKGDLGMFPDGTFDFCFSMNVFQHISEREAVLKYIEEAGRVLKPDGLFRFHVYVSQRKGPRRRKGGTWFGVVFSREEIECEARRCGFEIESLEERDTGPLWERPLLITCRRRSTHHRVTESTEKSL
jgi:SAM-dependent methyltransferase